MLNTKISRTEEERGYIEGDIVRKDVIELLFSLIEPVSTKFIQQNLIHVSRPTTISSTLAALPYLTCIDLQVTKKLINRKYVNMYLLIRINHSILDFTKNEKANKYNKNQKLPLGDNHIFEEVKKSFNFSLINKVFDGDH